MKYFLLPLYGALLWSAPFVAGLPATSAGRNAHEHQQAAPAAKGTPRITAAELSALNAPDWRGTLTYLDYGTRKSVVLNTALHALTSQANRLVLLFDYEEPNHTHVFGADTLTLTSDGTQLRWDGTAFAVKAKQRLPGQTLRLVLEGTGQDDNRPVLIRKTLLLSPHQFVVRKQVQFAADTAFVQRNQYSFTR